MKWDQFDFKIAGHYLPALINADESGMTDEEASDLQSFVESATQQAHAEGFTVGHWACDESEADDWGKCAVSGLFAMRCIVSLVVYREA